MALAKATTTAACASALALLARLPVRGKMAAMLGADKFSGAKKLQATLTDRHGCTALLAVQCAEIEIDEVDQSVLPWADAVVAALDAFAPVET